MGWWIDTYVIDCKKFHVYEPEDQPSYCKNSFLAQSTKSRKYKWGKGSTFNSKNMISIFTLLLHSVSVCISALALSLRLTEDGVIYSPVSGSKGGSIVTLWHTSCNHPAVRSCNSLWRIKDKPPLRWVLKLTGLKLLSGMVIVSLRILYVSSSLR